MAKIKGPLLSSTASGRFARVLSFRDTRHGPVATRFHYPGSRNAFVPSQAQLDNRALYGSIVASWRALSQAERDQYDVLAAPYVALSGWNYYLRQQMIVPPSLITETSLTAGFIQSVQASYVTPSISPSANHLLLAAISGSADTSGDNVTPGLTGNGLNWVLVASVLTSTNWGRISLFRSMGAAPAPGPLTFNYSANQDGVVYSAREFNHVDTGGADGADAIVQSVSAQLLASSGQSLALAAFGSPNNATFGAFSLDSTNVTAFNGSPGSGFTELMNESIIGSAYSYGGFDEWREDNDISVDMTWSKSGDLGGIAIEIKSDI